VLEIGFGHGRTIARLAAIASEGTVAGVEVSQGMLRMASRFNRRLIEEGRIVLTIGNAASMPYPAERFDRALSVHTLYFWSSLAETLREICRVMRPGGRLVLGFRSSEDDSMVRNFPRSVYRFYRSDKVERSLEETGFQDIRLERSTSAGKAVAFAVAVRGA
jgi:ubiquinone/menaquinone biosynthesis C-methylase UbiE